MPLNVATETATGNVPILCGIEEKWGDGGGSSPSAFVVRRTNYKVDPSRPELTSGEMRPDPFRAPSRLGATEIKGEFGIEVVPGAHDELFAAALHGEWDGDILEPGKNFVPRSLFLEELLFGRAIKYTGAAVEKLTLTFTPDKLVEGTVSYMAKDRTELAASTVPPAKVTEAPETLAAANWDGVFAIDGLPSDFMTSLTIDITRAISLHMVLGSKYPTSAHAGRFDVTGSMTVRARGTEWWNIFHNEQRFGLEVTIKGVPDSHTYTFKLPRLLSTSSSEDFSSPDDLLIDVPWSAEVDPDTHLPLIITRTT